MKNNQAKQITEPYGGHMSNPPKNCLLKQFVFTDPTEEIEWIDNVLCAKRCPEYCQRRKEYDKQMKSKTKERETQEQEQINDRPKLRRRKITN